MNAPEDRDYEDGGMEMLAIWGTAALLFLGTVMHQLVGWLA